MQMLEQRGETGYGLADKIRNSIQRWQERFPLENPKLIERYKKGEFHVLLKFSAGLVSKEFVIVFEAEPHIPDEKIPGVHGCSLWEQFRIELLKIDSKVPPYNCKREAVLIDNAQAVQSPDDISLPSLVWFNSADRIFGILPHALYLSKALGLVVSDTRARKLDPLAFAAICTTPESACQVVERRSEILNCIAGDEQDDRRDWLHVRDAIRSASIRIHLADRFVWPTIDKSVNLDFQIRDVMIGPFDLDSD